MTIDEMIEVLEAYKRGEKIEFKNGSSHDWTPCDPTGPTWDFYRSEYRIAKPKPKKVKMLCCTDGEALFWTAEHLPYPSKWIRIPEEDKEITLP